jgi:hypothetical protein
VILDVTASACNGGERRKKLFWFLHARRVLKASKN